MKSLSDAECRQRLVHQGIAIDRRDAEHGSWYEARVSDAATYDATKPVSTHSAAYNLIDCLLVDSSDAGHEWILWLNGRVYTDDGFAMSLFAILNRLSNGAETELSDGYAFDPGERNLAVAYASLALLVGWDAIVGGGGGAVALTLEHDGRIVYRMRRTMLARSPAVSDYLAHFGFSDETISEER